MIRIKFQQSLDELKERLLVMAGLVAGHPASVGGVFFAR